MFIKYQGFKIISYFRQTWVTILSFWVWSHCRWPCDDWHLFCSKGWPQETASCTFSFSVHFCLYVVILFRKNNLKKSSWICIQTTSYFILGHYLKSECWFSSMPSVDPPRIKIYVERTILFTDCNLNKHNPAFNWLQIRCICCEYTRAMKSYDEIIFSPVLKEITGRRMA